MEEAKQMFTVLTFEESILKIVIVSNSNLIVLSFNGDIYNLGRFDFVNKFMKLKAEDDDIDLKYDFGKVAVTKF
jgi:hypothetical protein